MKARIIKLILLFLVYLIGLAGCESLENEGGKDFIDVTITVDQPETNSKLQAYSGSSVLSAAIAIVPATVTEASYSALNEAYDTQLQDMTDNTVYLRAPLNEKLKLLKAAYLDNFALNYITDSQPKPYALGFSDEFVLTAADEEMIITVSMLSTDPWRFVDGDGAVGINKDSTQWAINGNFAVFSGKLYVAWDETRASDGNQQIRIAEWDGSSTWNFIDGNGLSGINKDPTKGAEKPRLIVYNSNLYVAWKETSNTTSAKQTRFAVWDGASTWTFKDGNVANGWNYDVNYEAHDPIPIIFDNKVYFAWYEKAGNDKTHIRYGYWDGTSSFVFEDGSGIYGLNKNTARTAIQPEMLVKDSVMYLAWHEYLNDSGSLGQIRVASMSGSTRTFVDENLATGLNFDTTKAAEEARMVVFLGDIYIGWNEKDASGIDQIRVKKYNGTNWSWADGGGVAGLNHDSTKEAVWMEMIVFNSKLYAAWAEDDANGVKQVRVARTGDGSTWEFVDGDGDTGLNYDKTQAAFVSAFVEFNSKLYLSFFEDINHGTDFTNFTDLKFNHRIIEANFD